MRVNAQDAKLEAHAYKTFEEYQKGSGQDAHSVTLDYSVFMKVPKLDEKNMGMVQRLYKAEDFDFRLKAGAAAIDRGAVIQAAQDWVYLS